MPAPLAVRPTPEVADGERKRTIRDLDYRPMIRDLPDGERPRERLRDLGAGALSNAELVAILLRTGNAVESVLDQTTRILAGFGGLAGLARASHADLCALRGMGEAKACQLLAAFELGRRAASAEGPARPTVHSPEDAATILQPEMAHLDQEHFKVLALDTRNRVIVNHNVFIGSVNATTIRTAEVFREAVRRNCPAILVAHNHPSGDPAPSPEDVGVTRDLIAAGKALDIEVVDHLVIGSEGYVSLKERGLAF